MPLSPSIYVMRLRHAAVFMNAGSYVISPASSVAVLTWRRSVARMTPSLIGIWYCFPVRLSVRVSVSAISGAERLRVRIGVVVRGGYGFSSDTVPSVGPSRQVLVPATLAAERPPTVVHRVPAALHAEPRLAHPTHSNQLRRRYPKTNWCLRAAGGGRRGPRP